MRRLAPFRGLAALEFLREPSVARQRIGAGLSEQLQADVIGADLEVLA